MTTTNSVVAQAKPPHIASRRPVSAQDVEDALNAAFRKVLWGLADDTAVFK
jgi:hypothetical protein